MKRKVAILLHLFLWATSVFTEEFNVRLTFEAATKDDQKAASDYTDIWAADGQRIVTALEEYSGLQFREQEIRVIVVEAPSSSGFGKIPMRMRASYPAETKKATLVHELGHRLQGHLFRKEDEDHPYLFLYLYDVWVHLYGKDFADQQVTIESQRRGLYDYETAWEETLKLTAEERKARWREFVTND